MISLPSQRQSTEAALDAVATPVLMVDAVQRSILFANRAAAKFIGSNAAGSTISRAFGLEAGRTMTDDRGRPLPTEENLLIQAAEGAEVGPVEVLWHGGPETISFVCYAEQVPAAAELPTAVVVSFFDVTELRKVRDELARVKTARDEFVHLAAHELRTPLTSLRLRIDAALRKHSDLPSLVAVAHAVDRMSRRVEQLIDVADVREHQVGLSSQHVDLLGLVDEAVRLLEPQAGWAKCSVTVSPSLPIFGDWDASRLRQVIASIISNALKFGAGKPVRIVPWDAGDDASITVIDHGIGVNPADREAIFERFQRRVPSSHYGGLGLDLWIARELVQQMGGSITVADTQGGGATFTVRVPKLAPPR